jgi:hypothetical protein
MAISALRLNVRFSGEIDGKVWAALILAEQGWQLPGSRHRGLRPVGNQSHCPFIQMRMPAIRVSSIGFPLRDSAEPGLQVKSGSVPGRRASPCADPLRTSRRRKRAHESPAMGRFMPNCAVLSTLRPRPQGPLGRSGKAIQEIIRLRALTCAKMAIWASVTAQKTAGVWKCSGCPVLRTTVTASGTHQVLRLSC